MMIIEGGGRAWKMSVGKGVIWMRGRWVYLERLSPSNLSTFSSLFISSSLALPRGVAHLLRVAFARLVCSSILSFLYLHASSIYMLLLSVHASIFSFFCPFTCVDHFCSLRVVPNYFHLGYSHFSLPALLSLSLSTTLGPSPCPAGQLSSEQSVRLREKFTVVSCRFLVLGALYMTGAP